MIAESVSIIGAGLVGSNLAIELVNRNLIKKISLYDYANSSGEKYYPFSSPTKGIKKIDVVAYYILKQNENMIVKCYYERAKKRIFDDLVIDCRDYKEPDIYVDLKISCDSESLILDSRKYVKEKNTNPFYYTKRDAVKYINIYVDYIIKYLQEKKYKENIRILYNAKYELSIQA